MNRTEFEQLALSHLDAMHRMAYTLTRHPDAAADLVQEAYLLAFRAWRSFERREGLPAREGETPASASMRAWLFRILHNAHFTAGRRSKRAALSDAHGRRPQGTARTTTAGVGSARLTGSVDARLKNAIDSLSDEHARAAALGRRGHEVPRDRRDHRRPAGNRRAACTAPGGPSPTSSPQPPR